LNLWGESIDASKQELHPLPEEDDDDHETATASVTTTSIDPGSPATDLPANPTDHIDRPTKPKPGASDATVTTTISVPESTVTATAEPTHTYSDSFLPSMFPTFGVSKKTQIWIYSSIALIITFCAGLGIYFLVKRKRSKENARDGYEFSMVNTDDDAEARRGLTSQGKNRPRRGGELYDAFAGESDDEDLYSEDDGYRDTPDTSGGSKSDESDEKSRQEQ
jgi:kexin